MGGAGGVPYGFGPKSEGGGENVEKTAISIDDDVVRNCYRVQRGST